MKKTGIYKIVNTLNNKVYVGSAIDIDTRWRRHKKMLIECYHHSKKLQNSYNKHGINNFNYEIIELCEFDVASDVGNQRYIDKLNYWDAVKKELEGL